MRLNPFRSSRSRAKDNWLKPGAKLAIAGVVLIVFGLIVLLSLFNAAGPTGAFLLTVLRRLLGWPAYVVPIACAWAGYRFVRPREEMIPRLQMVGSALLILGIIGIFHVIGVSPEDAYQTALEGKGGGLIGFTLSFPLIKAFSWPVALLIFTAALFSGLFLALNMTPLEVWEWFLSFVPAREEIDEDEDDEEDEEGDEAGPVPTFRISRMGSAGPDPSQLRLQEQQRAEEEQKELARKQMRSANKKYRPPDINILHSSVGKPDSGNVKENRKKIQSTLEKFGISVTMGKESIGPTVTQYTLRPEEGVKLARITALQNDLSLALAAHPIRIEAPIPGTSLVGIEIPNKDVSLVRLRDLITSRDFKKSTSPLTLSLGKDVAGQPRSATLESMPHLLVAGATGSGKSIFVNTLILSLLYRNSPALVKMIMVDPKRVELSLFNGIPHLLTPVITDADKTLNALRWAVKEMDRRYKLLSESGSRNLASYNANNPDEAMPMIVIVIDELADLMATHARDVEGSIVRLAQMARAIGIHLVLATQRPSVNVITGLIKANVPARIAFNVASQIDSRTVLDMAGAEKLLGSGDMLFLPSDQAKPMRLQGGFVSEEEVRQVVADIVEKNPDAVVHDDEIVEASRSSSAGYGGSGDAEDDLFEEAKNLVIDSGKASASLLQRRLRVGYARAARLLDMLEEDGVIGPQEGNKPREVFVQSEEDYEDEEEYMEEEETDESDPQDSW